MKEGKTGSACIIFVKIKNAYISLVRKSGKISHETYRYKCMDKIKTDSK
jgi:hypothetical protein